MSSLRSGLTAVLIGMTYGLQPYGSSSMGWGNPFVIGCLVGGAALLVAFVFVERRVAEPMFRLELFKIRMFAAGNTAGFLASLARGGLTFMLIIWLQGIWLPLHGYNFEDTPLWAGIYMLPLTGGFFMMGPLSGYLSDRFGARFFSTGGMLVTAAGFVGLMLLPPNFYYPAFAVIIFAHRHGDGHVRRPQHDGDHEFRTGGTSRRFLRDARDLSKYGEHVEHHADLYDGHRRAWRRVCRTRCTAA